MKWRVVLAAASILAGFSTIAVVTHRTGSDLRDVAFHLSPAVHLLALLLAVVEVGGRGMRFYLLARGMGVPLRLSSAILAPFLGDAAGAATPSRVGTDAGKLACLLRDGMGLGGGAAVLLGDLILEAAIVLTGGLAILIIAPFAWLAVLGAMAYSAITLVLGAAGVYMARLPSAKEPPRLWRRLRLAARRWRQVRVVGRGFLRRSRRLKSLSPRMWVALYAVSAVHFVGRLAMLPVVAWGVTPHQALPALVAWPLGLIWVAGFLPPPSGGGGVELGFLAAFSDVIPREGLAGSLLWWRFYAFYLTAISGAVAGLLVFGKDLFTGLWSKGEGARQEGGRPAPAEVVG